MFGCVFCEIIAGTSPATIVHRWGNEATAFVPLDPVCDGHILIVPNRHVRDAADDADLTGRVFAFASQWARARRAEFNLITSAGAAATQSIMHLHVHVIPRVLGDQLMVPWGTLHGENPRDPHRCKGIARLESELAALRSSTVDTR